MTEPYTCRVEVRWADLDLLGHVNNTKYFEYGMEARVKFYEHCVLHPDGVRRPALVLRKADMDYLRPILLSSGPLTIETWVTHIGTTSYSIRHRMRDKHGELCAEGSAVMVGFDLKQQKPRPLSDEERTALGSYLMSNV